MRILLFTPITIQVEAAKRLGFHVTSVWHRYGGQSFFDQIISDVRKISDTFIEGDLFGENEWLDRVIDIYREHPETILIPGVPDDFLEPFLRAAEKIGRLPNPFPVYDIFKSKATLRKVLHGDEVLRVGYKKITSYAMLERELYSLCHKSVLKPSVSSGSKDIFLIETAEDIRNALQRWKAVSDPPEMVLEDFLDGHQFSVEVISREGQHEILGVTSKFSVEPPYYVENGGVFPALISSPLYSEIVDITCRFLDKVGFKNGPTHTEVMATRNGVKIIESNMRMGGLIPFLIQGAHGIDANEFLIEFMTGRVSEYVPQKGDRAVLGILNFGTGGRLISVDGQDEVRDLPYLVKMNIWARVGEVLREPSCNEQRHGYVVVSGSSLEEALLRLDAARARLKPRLQEDECPTFEESTF